jgi:hypothetical protein
LTPARPHGAAPTGLERPVGRPLTPAELAVVRDLVSRRRLAEEADGDRARWGKGTGTKSGLYRRPR